MKRGLFALFVFVLATVIVTAANANVVGTDAQNFNPTTSGLDFVTVQSGRTLDPGVANFGLFFNYAVNTLSFLDKADPKSVQNKTRLNDRLLSADLNFGLGLADNWDIGISLPFLLSQEIDNSNQVTYFSSTGNTEQRINTKYRFYQNERTHMAIVLSASNNNIADNPYTGSGAGPTTSAELAISREWSKSWFGFNFGHRWRNPGTSLAPRFGFDPVPNQFTYSAAWSRLLDSVDTKLIMEVFGTTPSQNSSSPNLTNRDLSNLELLAGIKHDATENLALHAGAGTELQQGFGSPDYRIYAGLNWTWGPLWKKRVSQPAPPPPVAHERTFVLTNLKFVFDSDELTRESKQEVDEMIGQIREIKDIREMLVEGHTDSKGSEEYNQKLSQRRANAIQRLVANLTPFDARKISARGYGESRPVADNSNYQGRALNRRVVVIVRTKNYEAIQLSK